jgi:hypothetical protein
MRWRELFGMVVGCVSGLLDEEPQPRAAKANKTAFKRRPIRKRIRVCSKKKPGMFSSLLNIGDSLDDFAYSIELRKIDDVTILSAGGVHESIPLIAEPGRGRTDLG